MRRGTGSVVCPFFVLSNGYGQANRNVSAIYLWRNALKCRRSDLNRHSVTTGGF